MLKLTAQLILAFGLAACQTIDRPKTISLKKANETPAQHRDNVVKVCGLATKQFENVEITVSRHHEKEWMISPTGLVSPTGLGVDWMREEPYTKEPEKRCVTGFIEPTCGWGGNIPQNNENYEAPVCVSTGTVYQWSIRQTVLKRD